MEDMEVAPPMSIQHPLRLSEGEPGNPGRFPDAGQGHRRAKSFPTSGCRVSLVSQS
jgi:hypothetical protein